MLHGCPTIKPQPGHDISVYVVWVVCVGVGAVHTHALSITDFFFF